MNEQWQSYWAGLFGFYGHSVVDCIRPHVWYDTKIPFWYRQNTLFFTKGGKKNSTLMLDIAHPELYQAHVQPGVKGSAKMFGLLPV